MLLELERIEAEARAQLAAATSAEAVEAWRLDFLGKKGALTVALRSLGQLPAEERPAAGQRANQLRAALEEMLAVRQEALSQSALAAELAAGAIDVRLPGRPQSLWHAAHQHPDAARDLWHFRQMGFQVFRSPEVEDDVTNFQLLNMPPDHPARDMWSTFYHDRAGRAAAHAHLAGADPRHAQVSSRSRSA